MKDKTVITKKTARVKHTIPECVMIPGTERDTAEVKYEIDRARKQYWFNAVPCPAPRMTKSDKWKKRPSVMKYFAFRDQIVIGANKMGFKLGDTLEAVFFVPMPDSWSEKKKLRMNGFPCKHIPDNDNYIKAFLDAMSCNDGNVWHNDCKKVWAYTGCILVYK